MKIISTGGYRKASELVQCIVQTDRGERDALLPANYVTEALGLPEHFFLRAPVIRQAFRRGWQDARQGHAENPYESDAPVMWSRAFAQAWRDGYAFKGDAL